MQIPPLGRRLPAVVHDFASYLPPIDAALDSRMVQHYGLEEWSRMRRALVTPPSHTCLRVNTLKAEAKGVLKEVDAWIDDYYRERFSSTNNDDAQTEAEVRSPPPPPRPYLHPMPPLSFDTIIIPSLPPQTSHSFPLLSSSSSSSTSHPKPFTVVVDRLCGEAVLRGADVFVRGAWSASPGIHPGCRVLLLMDLHRQSQRGCLYSDYEGEALLIGQGTAVVSRTELFTATKGLGIRVTHRVGFQAPPFNGLLPGVIFPQNLPSLLVGHVLSPSAGSSVIDLCACPGGKATHLVSLMRGKGLVVACDRSRKKVKELKALSEVMGMSSCLCPLVLDSTHAVLPKTLRRARTLPSSQPPALVAATPRDKDDLHAVEGFYPETFDHVLLDPPCSALGLRPRLSVPTTASDLDAFVLFQQQFWWSAVFLLKVGGSMTYSTCTINPAENEGMVRFALDTYPCMRLVPAEPRLGKAGSKGVEGEGLTEGERGMVQVFLPGEGRREGEDRLDMSGFFVAKFEKVKSVFEEEEGKEEKEEERENMGEGEQGKR
ncbi:hypothetical protein VYU27_004427 [Nannochloropsis oceanica]